MTEFHEGEREIQARAGETALADRLRDLISDSLVQGAIPFIGKQPMAIVGSRNADNEVWASLLTGNAGFAKAWDARTILFNTGEITSNHKDIFFSNILHNPEIGSLFIELSTRKRLRVNGTCRYENSIIEFSVKQSYPNCPKYIQRRIISTPEYVEKAVAATTTGKRLPETAIGWIKKADTFFVASAGAGGELDASHRGGNAGFIEVLENNTLKIPDYPGNSLFNTFGNMVQNAKAGLLFIDFDKGETLQLTGRSSLLFNQASERDMLRTKGTGRYWLFDATGWIHTTGHHNLHWKFLDYSPFNP